MRKKGWNLLKHKNFLCSHSAIQIICTSGRVATQELQITIAESQNKKLTCFTKLKIWKILTWIISTKKSQACSAQSHMVCLWLICVAVCTASTSALSDRSLWHRCVQEKWARGFGILQVRATLGHLSYPMQFARQQYRRCVLQLHCLSLQRWQPPQYSQFFAIVWKPISSFFNLFQVICWLLFWLTILWLFTGKLMIFEW